jgi:Lon protease-like protein
MMRSPIQTRFEDLPAELAVFPLSGALLLPWGRLPLNIFEPRYLNMTLDALKVGRIFGMVQPDYDKTPRERIPRDKPSPEEPAIYSVGCAGRVSSFEETEDGRLLIMLKGLARFRVVKELESVSGYRRVRADFSAFADDLEPPPKFILDRERLLKYLRPYLEAQAMPVNADVMKSLSDASLVTSLCMICPFDPREKQALLEAVDMQERATALIKLLQMGLFETGGSPDGPKQ